MSSLVSSLQSALTDLQKGNKTAATSILNGLIPQQNSNNSSILTQIVNFINTDISSAINTLQYLINTLSNTNESNPNQINPNSIFSKVTKIISNPAFNPSESNPNQIITTFLEAVLSYVDSNFSNIIDTSAIQSIVQSLVNGNFTSSTKPSASNSNQTVTTLNIPYQNGKKIDLYIINDATTNTSFFELPNVLNKDGSKKQASIAYNIQKDGSINGKIIIANGKEIPFITTTISTPNTGSPDVVAQIPSCSIGYDYLNSAGENLCCKSFTAPAIGTECIPALTNNTSPDISIPTYLCSICDGTFFTSTTPCSTKPCSPSSSTPTVVVNVTTFPKTSGSNKIYKTYAEAETACATNQVPAPLQEGFICIGKGLVG
jgi:hypothetical protein